MAVLGIITPGGGTIQEVCPSFLGSGFAGHLVWLQLVSRWEWLWCYLISVCGHIVACSCRLGIIYKCRTVVGSDSLVIEPPAGSLLFAAPVRHLAAEFRLCGLIECEDCFWIIVCRTLRFVRHWRVTCVMAAGRDTPVGARSDVTFDVTLDIPWNAPEAHIQLHSAGVFDLEKSIQDVFGLCDRRPDAAVVHVTQGRDDRSVR